MQKTLSALTIASIFFCMHQNSVAGTFFYAGRAQISADTVREGNRYVDEIIDRLFQSLQRPVQIKNSRFRDQLSMIDSVLEREPSNTSALHLQAQIFAYLKEYDKSIAILSKTILSHPHLTKLYVFRGALYDIQGKKSGAKKDYQKAWELVNRNIDSLADGNVNKLYLTGTVSILELLLGGTLQKALSTFDRCVVGTYDTDLTDRLRKTIETFDKGEFLASYQRGHL